MQKETKLLSTIFCLPVLRDFLEDLTEDKTLRFEAKKHANDADYQECWQADDAGPLRSTPPPLNDLLIWHSAWLLSDPGTLSSSRAKSTYLTPPSLP